MHFPFNGFRRFAGAGTAVRLVVLFVALAGASALSSAADAACDLTLDAAALATVNAALKAGPVTLKTTATECTGAGTQNASGNGDIIIAADYALTGTNALTLDAYRSVVIKGKLTSSLSSLNIVYNDGGSDGTMTTSTAGTVTIKTGTLFINGQKYTLIKNKAQLQGMSTAGYYALNADLTFTGTNNFQPIGWTIKGNNEDPKPFLGEFDGLGHKINGLDIRLESFSNIGMFSRLGDISSDVKTEVRNILLGSAFIKFGSFSSDKSGSNAGIVAGNCDECNMSNLHVQGSILVGAGADRVGGIVGAIGGSIDRKSGILGFSSSDIAIKNIVGQWQYGNEDIGGAVGFCSGGLIHKTSTDVRIDLQSKNASAVFSNSNIGGLVGYGCAVRFSSSKGAIRIIGKYLGEMYGGLAGTINTTDAPTIESSHSSVSIEVGGNGNGRVDRVGGLVGETLGKDIKSVYYTGKIYVHDESITRNVGGAFGRLEVTSVDSNMWSSGSIVVDGGSIENIGGLIGNLDAGSSDKLVVNSFATATMKIGRLGTWHGYIEGIGGFVGRTEREASITKSYASGTLTVVDEPKGVGGFVGNCYSNGQVTNSFSLENVNVGKNAVSAGGFAGNLSCTAYDSFSAGKVVAGAGSTFTGGFNGKTDGGSATFSYWDKTSSGWSTSASGTGLTTAQMHSASSFTGWDFSKIWYKPTSKTYPRLRGLVLPITWKVANASFKYGTLPAAGAATLYGIETADAANVKAVVTVYDSAGKVVTLSKKTPVGVYTEKVSKLTGSAAGKYVLTGLGNANGTLTIKK